MVAISCTTISHVGTGLLSQLWVLYIGYVLNMLWDRTSRKKTSRC